MGRLLITLAIGGVIGWLASIVMKANGPMGLLANVIVAGPIHEQSGTAIE